jgi:tRNA-specific 2-thiouridylase
MKKKIIVGLSGGIDSAVAAYLLKEAGYEVIGLYIDVKAEGSKDDLRDAKAIASHLGIKIRVKKSSYAFKKKIIDNYVACYLKAVTPNPCIRCNKLIKFKELFSESKKCKAQYVATGHYARIYHDTVRKKYILEKAKDKNKDQSYFLYTLTSRDLSKVIFPLGQYRKKQVKVIAQKCGLDRFARKESQEVCFVPNKDHLKFLRENYRIKSKKGDILDINGKKIGCHKGIAAYTVGQRKGMGVAHSEPLYVIGLDGKNNFVIAGTKKDLYSKKANIKQVVFSSKEKKRILKVKVKIRYRHSEASAVIRFIKKGIWQVDFLRGQRAITPGQSAVFYDKDKVIGGGVIKEVFQ